MHKKIPSAIGDITEYLTGQYTNSMFIVGTNENEIMNIVIMLKSSFSKGNDVISSKIVKHVIMEIASRYQWFLMYHYQLEYSLTN